MPSNNGDKNKLTPLEEYELGRFLGGGSIDEAVKPRDDATSPLKYMMTMEGDRTQDNAPRYDVRDRRDAVAFASLISKCESHQYTRGINEVQTILGLLTAIKGKRIIHLVEGIIGEKRNFGGTLGSWTQKLQNIALNQNPKP